MTFILGIITARGGSKGIPDKNIRQCGGKPLIAWTIEAARNSRLLGDVILSTDSQRIADVATGSGLVTDHLRPEHLASDHAKSLDVIQYELEKYEQENGRAVDAAMVLQPTTPMRRADDIDAAIDAFILQKADSLISVCEAGAHHPSTMYTAQDRILTPLQSEHIGIRRQDMKPVFLRNGAIYIASRAEIMDRGRLVGPAPSFYEMPRERSVNIDELFDLELADWLLGRHA